jgi:hypothetical protein
MSNFFSSLISSMTAEAQAEEAKAKLEMEIQEAAQKAAEEEVEKAAAQARVEVELVNKSHQVELFGPLADVNDMLEKVQQAKAFAEVKADVLDIIEERQQLFGDIVNDMQSEGLLPETLQKRQEDAEKASLKMREAAAKLNLF